MRRALRGHIIHRNLVSRKRRRRLQFAIATTLLVERVAAGVSDVVHIIVWESQAFGMKEHRVLHLGMPFAAQDLRGSNFEVGLRLILDFLVITPGANCFSWATTPQIVGG